MPRRKKVDIARAVEDGIALLQGVIDHLTKQQRRHKLLKPFEIGQLLRATEQLHAIRQDVEGPIPKAVLQKMDPEDLQTLTSLLMKYGMA